MAKTSDAPTVPEEKRQPTVPHAPEIAEPSAPLIAFVVLATIVAAAFYFLEDNDWFLRGQHRFRQGAGWVWGLVPLAAVLGGSEKGHARSQTLFLTSLVALPIALGWGAALLFLFALLAVGLARTPGPLLLRCLALLALWTLVPLWKLDQSRETLLNNIWFFAVWATLPISGIYVLAERVRGGFEKRTPIEEAAYLIAFPRLLCPFIQAIPPHHFFESAERPMTRKRLVGVAVLAIYGAGLHAVLSRFSLSVGPQVTADASAWLTNLVYLYAANAGTLFVGVSVYRLLGFDIGSGFNWPVLADSFSDFYRRFNYYIYRSVVFLYWLPLYEWLKNRVPRKVAFLLCSYLGALAGVFGSGYLLQPFAISTNPIGTLRMSLHPALLLGVASLWSLAFLPQLLPRSWGRRTSVWIKRILLWTVALGIVTLAWRSGLYVP